MKIMGVDPGIACTGISLPDGETVAVRPKTKGDDRLMELAERVHLEAVASEAELVVMEGLGGIYQGEAAKVIPMLHGALRLELKRLPVPYMVLLPSTLKKFATGKGTADKTAMALAALKRLGREYGTSDECDADWLRIAGRFAYGYAELIDLGRPALAVDRVLSLPQAQLLALTRNAKGKPIEWPTVGSRVPWPRLGLR